MRTYKRDYKAEYANYDGTEAVKKKRAQRNKARRMLEREGIVHKGDGKDVAVTFAKAEGAKCARSWKISKEIGSDKEFPDLTPRDAEAVREWQTRFGRTV